MPARITPKLARAGPGRWTSELRRRPTVAVMKRMGT
jgi:hypothetical protein